MRGTTGAAKEVESAQMRTELGNVDTKYKTRVVQRAEGAHTGCGGKKKRGSKQASNQRSSATVMTGSPAGR